MRWAVGNPHGRPTSDTLGARGPGQLAYLKSRTWGDDSAAQEATQRLETPPRAAAGPTRRSRKQGFRYATINEYQPFPPCHRSSTSSSTTPLRTTKDGQPPWTKNPR